MRMLAVVVKAESFKQKCNPNFLNILYYNKTSQKLDLET